MTKVEDESYELYITKRDRIHSPLARHAMTLEDAFNKLEGVTYNKTKGTMYLFLRIIPPKEPIMLKDEDGNRIGEVGNDIGEWDWRIIGPVMQMSELVGQLEVDGLEGEEPK
ncbi:hypothetical protein V6N13_123965 [Hibiscus sabdariffa]|uniref:Uncharacterized protein n=1 Tax=Hibiscus sabdariffa TaxID=183260 RepID=A0ABR2CPJ4_9ROSI